MSGLDGPHFGSYHRFSSSSIAFLSASIGFNGGYEGKSTFCLESREIETGYVK